MASTNAFSKIYVSSTPQNSVLAVEDYALLTWVEIGSVGNLGETGKSTNVLSYNTWNDSVIQKGKGLTDAGSPTLEVLRIPTDAGQTILRNAGAVGNEDNYAFKIAHADGTVHYNRGMVTGPTRPNGGNEDFVLEVYNLALQQEEISVNPGAGGNPPVLTVAPAITGTAEVGETLTSNNGTFTGDATITYTYQWFAGGVAISGATSSTLVLASAQLGKVITVRVTATNSSGTSAGFSAATSAVAP